MFSLWANSKRKNTWNSNWKVHIYDYSSMLNAVALFQLISWKKSSKYLDALIIMITPSRRHVEHMAKRNT